MPYDYKLFQTNANELRGMLGSAVDGMSDRAVMEHALIADERVIPKETKDYLRNQYGEGFWSSAGKSFLRSSMLDTAGDLVGLEASKYSESAPIQEDQNTYGSMLGGVGGMLALQAIPVGGQALGAGRLGTMALRAALQAGAGANTNWREQQDQMRVGDRIEMSPGTAAISATTSGLGQLVGGTARFNRLQDKGWDVGTKLLKQAYKGGIPNRAGTAARGLLKASGSPALEAGANIGEESAQYLGEAMWDNRNLTNSGKEGKAGYLQRVGMTGAFGALADLGLNRPIGGVSDWRKARGVVNPKDINPDDLDPDDVTALNPPSTEPDATVTDRPDPVDATNQGNPPHELEGTWQEILTAKKAQSFKGARNRALLQYGAEKMAQMEAAAVQRMRTQNPDRYLVEIDPNDPTKKIWSGVYHVGDQHYLYRQSDEQMINITPDPEMGDHLDLRNQTTIQPIKGAKHRKDVGAVHLPGHRPIPGKDPITATFEDKLWRIISHRPADNESGPLRWIGAIPLFNEADPNAKPDLRPGLNTVREFELDSIKDRLLQESLKEALEDSRAKRKGTNQVPVYKQGDLLAMDPTKSGQAGIHLSAPKIAQMYTEAGGEPINFSQPNVAMPPPIRGLGGDEGEGTGGGGAGPAPSRPGGGGAPGAPPGAAPSGGKPVVQLGPNDLPSNLDQKAQVLFDKWNAGIDLTDEELNYLRQSGVLGAREREATRAATGGTPPPEVPPVAPTRNVSPARRHAEDAVANGYPGTVEQAEADITNRARELYASEHGDDATHTGQGLLEKIADLGGLSNKDDPSLPGEHKRLREFRDTRANQIGGVTGVFRELTHIRDNKGVLNVASGRTLNDMADLLRSQGWDIQDGNQLLGLIEQAKRDYDNGITNDFDIGKYAGGIRSMLGEKWWGDGRAIPNAPKPKPKRAPRKPKVVESAPVAPTGPSRRQQAEDLLANAAEAYDAYHRQKGKRATDAEAQTVYANRLGKAGIDLALAEGLIDVAQAKLYAKLLTKKY